jgi:hypothetical protein
MIALTRYQLAVLLRGHRWVGPLLRYATLLTFVADGSTQPLREGLNWSAAMLVPAVAWLTRSARTAEPPAARACVAVAGGPHRAHLAALAAALAGGVLLGAGGAGYEVAISKWPAHPSGVALAVAAGLVGAIIFLPLLAAVALVAGAWLASTLLAARRG